MEIIKKPTAEVAEYFRRGGEFETVMKARRPVGPIVVKKTSDQSFEATFRISRAWVSVKGKALDENSTAVTCEAAAKRMGFIVGLITLPLLGLGIFIWLKTWTRVWIVNKFRSKWFIPTINESFGRGQNPPAGPVG